jgi:hypothetical protein
MIIHEALRHFTDFSNQLLMVLLEAMKFIVNSFIICTLHLTLTTYLIK